MSAFLLLEVFLTSLETNPNLNLGLGALARESNLEFNNLTLFAWSTIGVLVSVFVEALLALSAWRPGLTSFGKFTGAVIVTWAGIFSIHYHSFPLAGFYFGVTAAGCAFLPEFLYGRWRAVPSSISVHQVKRVIACIAFGFAASWSWFVPLVLYFVVWGDYVRASETLQVEIAQISPLMLIRASVWAAVFFMATGDSKPRFSPVLQVVLGAMMLELFFSNFGSGQSYPMTWALIRTLSAAIWGSLAYILLKRVSKSDNSSFR